MNPSRTHIRQAQALIGQARERTQQSIDSVLETANRILIFQLHCPDLVLDSWTLYQHIVTPRPSRFSRRGTQEW